MKNIVCSEVFDKDYIDDQFRRCTTHPIISGRSDTANEHAFTSADDMNELAFALAVWGRWLERYELLWEVNPHSTP